MQHSETDIFQKRIVPLDARLVSLRQEQKALADLLAERRSKNAGLKSYKQLPTKRLEQQIHACSNEMLDIETRKNALMTDLSHFTWPEVRDMLIQVEENIWNARQLELGKKEREDYEGKFEDSYRDYMGWPLGASQGCTDFPDMSEGKYIGGQDTTFRLGKVGKRAYGALLRTLSRQFDEETMKPEQWEAMFEGEVSAGKIYNSFPINVQAKFQQQLAPDSVLASYDSIVFLTDVGFFKVPRFDFTAAFTLSYVSQMSPKYRLRRDYIESRIKIASERSKVAA